MTFKINDRVCVDSRFLSNEASSSDMEVQTGKVVSILGETSLIGIEFDNNIFGHTCENMAKKGHGWNVPVRHVRHEHYPEYFSGLNWREASKLLGMVVEYSSDGEYWESGILESIVGHRATHRFSFHSTVVDAIYIRTCPETYAHPTITIGGVELPRPEHIEPFAGTHYFFVNHGKVNKYVWSACPYDIERLEAGLIHRTEARAQAWADWWQNTVMAAVKGGE